MVSFGTENALNKGTGARQENSSVLGLRPDFLQLAALPLAPHASYTSNFEENKRLLTV